MDNWAFVRAPGRCLRGLKCLRRPVATRRVRGRRAGLQSCGDSGMTDDRRAGGDHPRGRRDGGWGGCGGRRRLPQHAGQGRLEAGGVENTLVVAVLAAGRRAAVFGWLGAVGEAVASLAAFPGDGELVGVFAVFSQHLRQEPPPRVDEPVAHLQWRQGQRSLLWNMFERGGGGAHTQVWSTTVFLKEDSNWNCKHQQDSHQQCSK